MKKTQESNHKVAQRRRKYLQGIRDLDFVMFLRELQLNYQLNVCGCVFGHIGGFPETIMQLDTSLEYHCPSSPCNQNVFILVNLGQNLRTNSKSQSLSPQKLVKLNEPLIKMTHLRHMEKLQRLPTRNFSSTH